MAARSRSKSPARATRSKTPTRATAAAVREKAAAVVHKAAEVEHDPKVQLAIAVAVIVAVWSQANGVNGSPSLPGFALAAKNGFQFNYPDVIKSIPVVGTLFTRYFGTSCNLVLALHVLNTVSRNASRGGFWLNNFAQVSIATFAGVILPAVLGGGNFVNAIFDDRDGLLCSSFFLVWYVVNHDIPFCPAPLGVWSMVSDVGGEALQILLALGSTLFTTNLVVAAVSAAEPFSSAWGRAIVTGVVVGTAGSFFPLNKGFKLANSAEASNAFAISFFLASNGFAFIDTLVNLALSLISDVTMNKVNLADTYEPISVGSQLNGVVDSVFGGAASFVVTVVVVNQLFGDMIPADTAKGFDLFNLMDHVMKIFNL